MSHVRRFDHLGLTVADFDVVTSFLVALGLEMEGRTFVEGEFLGTVCGIPDARTEVVMLKPPGDCTRLELSSFVRPGLRARLTCRDGNSLRAQGRAPARAAWDSPHPAPSGAVTRPAGDRYQSRASATGTSPASGQTIA